MGEIWEKSSLTHINNYCYLVEIVEADFELIIIYYTVR